MAMSGRWNALMRQVMKRTKQRYVLAVMGFLAVVNAYTMRVCLSVTIVDMVAKTDTVIAKSAADNTYCEENYRAPFESKELTSLPVFNKTIGEFDWSDENQGVILSSFFWGYVVTQLPGGLLADKIGGKHLLGCGILCTSLLTLLTPLATHLGGAPWLIAVRILEGLGEGVTYPALNLMLAKWAPPTERSKLGTIVFSGSQIGTVMGMALSGTVVHNWGWEGVFYLFGSLGVVWYVLWLLLCYDDPCNHPYASDDEVSWLRECLPQQDLKAKKKSTPWKCILTSVPLWGLLVANVGQDWGFYTLLNDLPKYMNEILHYDITTNGYLSALPYILMWIVSMLSSCLADWLLTRNILSTTNVRKTFTTTASLGPAIGLLAVAYIGCNRDAAISFLAVGVGIMGSFYPGIQVNNLDLSPNYAGTLMGITNGAGNVCGIITPYIVGIITTKHTLEEWRTVFFISAAIFIVSNIIFVFTASGETQAWNSYGTSCQSDDPALHPTEYGSIADNRITEKPRSDDKAYLLIPFEE